MHLWLSLMMLNCFPKQLYQYIPTNSPFNPSPLEQVVLSHFWIFAKKGVWYSIPFLFWLVLPWSMEKMHLLLFHNFTHSFSSMKCLFVSFVCLCLFLLVYSHSLCILDVNACLFSHILITLWLVFRLSKISFDGSS